MRLLQATQAVAPHERGVGMDTFIVTWPDWTALRSLQATLALRRKLSEAAVVRPKLCRRTS